MIYQCEDGSFVISSHHFWMPGCYATKEAARYAFQFTQDELCELSAEVCKTRNITTEMLRAVKRQRDLINAP